MELRILFISCFALIVNLFSLCSIFIGLVGNNTSSREKISSQQPQNNVFQKAPKIEKIVLIIIDAMRFDFVPQMEFTGKMLNEGSKACLFKVRLDGPTVTLPRIKALMTGASSSYWDFLANLKQTSDIGADNFVWQAMSAGKEVVFYGDDTWLKLFPGTEFARSEGVSSFFVTDFYEVDSNVTRNLRKELNSPSFDFMIAHYLGVDHVGHVHGPNHPLIPEKLAEMDSIIQDIYQKLSSIPSKNPHVILITGDHGMANIGGHGGDTLPEVTTPLVIITVATANSSIQSTCVQAPSNWFESPFHLSQYDIAPTLSFLWDLSFPSKCRGVIANEVISVFPLTDHIEGIRRTLKHLFSFLPNPPASEFSTALSNLDRDYAHLQKSGGSDEHMRSLLSEYQKLVSQTQHLVVEERYQDVLSLCLGTFFLLEIGLMLLSEFYYVGVGIGKAVKILSTAQMLISLFFPGPGTAVLAVAGLVYLISRIGRLIFALMHIRNYRFVDILYFTTPFVYFSSSFVEEEHFVVYFLYSTCVVLSTLQGQGKEQRLRSFSLLLIHRFCSSLNSTGQKWSDAPDLNSMVESHQASTIVTSIAFALLLLRTQTMVEKMVVVLIGVHKLNYFSLLFTSIPTHWEAKMCYFAILCSGLFTKLKGKSPVASSWALLSSLLLRQKNIILIPVVAYQAAQAATLTSGRKCLLGFLLLCAFFYQGNSNNITTIDISLGYTGLSSYNEYLVGLLTFASTYSLPILVIVTAFEHLDGVAKMELMQYLTLSTCASNFLYSIVLLLMRQHLFIWSVFVPKLLYLIASTLLILILVLVLSIETVVSNLASNWSHSVSKKEK